MSYRLRKSFSDPFGSNIVGDEVFFAGRVPLKEIK